MRAFGIFLMGILLWGALPADEEESTFFALEMNVSEETLPKPLFSPMERDSQLPQVPKVNLITGEYCEESVDLVVAGSEPLSIRRFYNHFSGQKEKFFGHWRVNPETLLLFHLEGKERLVGIGEQNSAFFFYDKSSSGGLLFQPERHKGFTSFSGQTNPLNTKVSYSKKSFGRNPNTTTVSCSWEGIICDGSGRKRTFSTDENTWPQVGEPFPTRIVNRHRDDEREIPMQFCPPYQGYVVEEKRPNGNVIRYGYFPITIENQYSPQPLQYVMKSMQAFSSTGVDLGSIELKSTLYHNNFTDTKMMESYSWVGSDGRQVVGTHMGTKFKGVRGLQDSLLAQMKAPGKPLQTYDYRIVKGKYNYDHLPSLERVSQKEGRYLETLFGKDQKVIQQNAPVGPKGEKCAIASYSYFPGTTAVVDGEGHKTLYRFNGENRLTAIEKYKGAELYCTEKSEWDVKTGNLLCKKIEDSKGIVCFQCNYSYDKNHNVIEEKVEGVHPIVRKYSEDGFNLLLSESDRPDKEVCYSYLPSTNLLESIFVKIKGEIAKRTFHFYDCDIGAVCVKTIMDDGKSAHADDVAGVTFRHITESTPRKTLPCIGLPEEQREYAGDQLLHKVRYTYHPSGKVTSEEHYDSNDHYAYTLYYEYDAEERLISKSDALGYRITFAYDSQGNLISQQGPKEDQYKEWRYDLANRPIEQREFTSDGKVVLLQQKYNRNSLLTSVIDGSGFETTYTYDHLGRLISTTYPDGSSERKEYDVLGNVVKVVDANGYVTQKKMNFRGQPVQIIHPDGTQEHFTYNKEGNLESHEDCHGVLTSYTYDLFDHLIRTETLSAVITATHSPFRMLSERDALGVETLFTYDLSGRKISERKEEREVHFVYDALGRVAEEHEGEVVTRFSYDLKGQLLTKKIEGYFEESYGYDAAGNRESTTTCVGTTNTLYDGRGQPITLIDPLGNRTEIAYSYEGGLRKKITDPRGITKSTLYDARERPILSETFDCEGHVIQKEERGYDGGGNQLFAKEYLFVGRECKEVIERKWCYGPMGRILSLIEAGEKTTLYHYDERGRLACTIKPDGCAIYRAYDSYSRLARFFGVGVDYRYRYDLKHRLCEIKDEIRKRALLSSYDSYDNIISEKLDTGIVIERSYDPYHRCTEITLPDSSTICYRYKGPYLHTVSRKGRCHTYDERNKSGKVTHMLLANGEELFYEWDPLLRWKSYKAPSFKATYSYDEGGDLTSYVWCDDTGTKTFSYTYDELHQVVNEDRHTYSYDSLYNRRTKDGKEYEINSLLQVQHDGERECYYDKNGNLLSDGLSTYEYDLLDRLIAVTREGVRTEYSYDALNRRLSKDKQFYIWDGQREIGMMEGGKMRELRVLGEGGGLEIGAAVLLEWEEESFVPLHDHCGSLIQILSMEGEVCGEAWYSAFGECESEGLASPWGFSSKRFDRESGLLYFGKRYYSPLLGRWITADPQGFQDGPNPYAYVGNNPLLFCDPLGLLATSLSEVHSTWDFCGWLWYRACSVVEIMGHDFILVPGLRDIVEGVGRFARGGDFFQAREYAGIYPSSGIEVSGVTKTYHNGIKTSLEAGLKQRDEISEANGGVGVVLLWEPSRGFVYDLLTALVAKIGFKTAYEKMSACYYQGVLEEDPDHEFFVTAHSRGCTRLNNIGHLLGPGAKNLTVEAYGPATILRDDMFKKVVNYVSKLDCVPWTSTCSYLRGVAGFDSNITFLSPCTMSPLTEHYLMGDTYKAQIYKTGEAFAKNYLHK